MSINGNILSFAVWIALAVGLISCGDSEEDTSGEKTNTFNPSFMELEAGWSLVENENDGKAISSEGYDVGKAVATSVPSTVLGALVKSGEYPDIYMKDNMANVDAGRFEKPWWFRKEFEIGEILEGSNYLLDLYGVNYSANVWLNGEQICHKDDVKGAFRTFEQNINEHIKTGNNVLAIEVFPPQAGDFTIGFVDWAPTPPDQNMGVWRPVAIKTVGAVEVRNSLFKSDLNTETLAEADLIIEAELVNLTDKDQKASVEVKIEGIEAKKEVELKAGESVWVKLDASEFESLNVKNPRIWWPVNMGEPELYWGKVKVLVDGVETSNEKRSFGIRKVEDYFNENGHRGYKINGKPIVIKGGGWVDELLLNDDTRTNEAQVKYAKHMNLNCIRFEGFWGTSEEIYHLCDKHGILAMVGFSCHWEWIAYLKKEFPEEENFGGIVTDEEQDLVASYFKDQVLWLRNHPSIFAWTAGSDFLPRPRLEKKYMEIMEQFDTDRCYLGAAKTWDSEVTGPTGVKMEGPYDYVPPVYWYNDTKRGGAYGFNTETGPGPQPPVLSSAKRMMGDAPLWPVDGNKIWEYHCGRHEFGTMKRYNKALENRYGKFDNIEDYLSWSQVASYEAMRPMYEAFSANRPNSTGVIQWMLNSAWPESFWQLYDQYLVPNGAFYATRKACRPLNIFYNYGDGKVYVSNELVENLTDLKAEVIVLDHLGNEKNRGSVDLAQVSAGAVQDVMTVSIPKSKENLYFVKVVLSGAEGQLADNFYWLSRKKDVMDPDYEKSSWIYTPQSEFGDLSKITSLPDAQVSLEAVLTEKDGGVTGEVVLANTGETLSFFNEVRLVDSESQIEVSPVFWSDNYVTLLPGEEVKLQVWCNLSDAPSGKVKIEANGLNSAILIK